MIYDWISYSDLTEKEILFILDSLVYCYTVQRALMDNRDDLIDIATHSTRMYAAAEEYGITHRSIRALLVRLLPSLLSGS